MTIARPADLSVGLACNARHGSTLIEMSTVDNGLDDARNADDRRRATAFPLMARLRSIPAADMPPEG